MTSDPCETCPLHAVTAVANHGCVPARVLFLSGAPRYHEDRERRAFASPLFDWFQSLLAESGIDSAATHYATMTGCRPPRQRPLAQLEIDACHGRIQHILEEVNPEVIALCGQEAVSAVLKQVSVQTAHGIAVLHDSRRYMPMRHPYAVSYHEPYVAELKQDLERLHQLLSRSVTLETTAEPATDEEVKPDSSQMSLF